MDLPSHSGRHTACCGGRGAAHDSGRPSLLEHRRAGVIEAVSLPQGVFTDFNAKRTNATGLGRLKLG